MKFLFALLFTTLGPFSYAWEEECRPVEMLDSSFLGDVQAIQGKISEGSQWISCLENLEQHKSVPDTAVSQFWHKLGGKKVFGLRCKFLDKDAEKEKIFSFITPEGFRTLTFPAFSQRIGSKLGGKETSRHPRTYIKFNHEGKELFISEFNKVGDDFDLHPVNSKMNGSSYVRTYETLLGSKRKSIPFTLKTPANPDGAKTCVEYHIKRYLDLVVSSTPVAPSESKQDYIRKIHKQLPDCAGVIQDEMINELASGKFP